ncbi:MAG: O-methyltransferase [Lachnospiraceae bacterium]|nr:O-methyltransferase [Lachnospiraceae bacterium]
MIIDERMVAFINSFDKGNTPFLNEIEKYALETEVPIVRKEMQNFMKFLLQMHRPKRILEVGTAIGFSALLMNEYGPAGCHITTIEKYEKRIPIAVANLLRAGKFDEKGSVLTSCDLESIKMLNAEASETQDGSITLIEGDALDVLKSLEGSYDLIFMDAAKGQYIHFLPDILRLLPEGGLLLSDNVLQDGDVLQSRFAVARRNRTIHARMREYLYTLTHHDALVTTILPVGDGITMSVKRTSEGKKA